MVATKDNVDNNLPVASQHPHYHHDDDDDSKKNKNNQQEQSTNNNTNTATPTRSQSQLDVQIIQPNDLHHQQDLTTTNTTTKIKTKNGDTVEATIITKARRRKRNHPDESTGEGLNESDHSNNENNNRNNTRQHNDDVIRTTIMSSTTDMINNDHCGGCTTDEEKEDETRKVDNDNFRKKMLIQSSAVDIENNENGCNSDELLISRSMKEDSFSSNSRRSSTTSGEHNQAHPIPSVTKKTEDLTNDSKERVLNHDDNNNGDDGDDDDEDEKHDFESNSNQRDLSNKNRMALMKSENSCLVTIPIKEETTTNDKTPRISVPHVGNRINIWNEAMQIYISATVIRSPRISEQQDDGDDDEKQQQQQNQATNTSTKINEETISTANSASNLSPTSNKPVLGHCVLYDHNQEEEWIDLSTVLFELIPTVASIRRTKQTKKASLVSTQRNRTYGRYHDKENDNDYRTSVGDIDDMDDIDDDDDETPSIIQQRKIIDKALARLSNGQQSYDEVDDDDDDDDENENYAVEKRKLQKMQQNRSVANLNNGFRDEELDDHDTTTSKGNPLQQQHQQQQQIKKNHSIAYNNSARNGKGEDDNDTMLKSIQKCIELTTKDSEDSGSSDDDDEIVIISSPMLKRKSATKAPPPLVIATTTTKNGKKPKASTKATNTASPLVRTRSIQIKTIQPITRRKATSGRIVVDTTKSNRTRALSSTTIETSTTGSNSSVSSTITAAKSSTAEDFVASVVESLLDGVQVGKMIQDKNEDNPSITKSNSHVASTTTRRQTRSQHHDDRNEVATIKTTRYQQSTVTTRTPASTNRKRRSPSIGTQPTTDIVVDKRTRSGIPKQNQVELASIVPLTKSASRKRDSNTSTEERLPRLSTNEIETKCNVEKEQNGDGEREREEENKLNTWMNDSNSCTADNDVACKELFIDVDNKDRCQKESHVSEEQYNDCGLETMTKKAADSALVISCAPTSTQITDDDIIASMDAASNRKSKETVSFPSGTTITNIAVDPTQDLTTESQHPFFGSSRRLSGNPILEIKRCKLDLHGLCNSTRQPSMLESASSIELRSFETESTFDDFVISENQLKSKGLCKGSGVKWLPSSGESTEASRGPDDYARGRVMMNHVDMPWTYVTCDSYGSRTYMDPVVYKIDVRDTYVHEMQEKSNSVLLDTFPYSVSVSGDLQACRHYNDRVEAKSIEVLQSSTNHNICQEEDTRVAETINQQSQEGTHYTNDENDDDVDVEDVEDNPKVPAERETHGASTILSENEPSIDASKGNDLESMGNNCKDLVRNQISIETFDLERRGEFEKEPSNHDYPTTHRDSAQVVMNDVDSDCGQILLMLSKDQAEAFSAEAHTGNDDLPISSIPNKDFDVMNTVPTNESVEVNDSVPDVILHDANEMDQILRSIVCKETNGGHDLKNDSDSLFKATASTRTNEKAVVTVSTVVDAMAVVDPRSETATHQLHLTDDTVDIKSAESTVSTIEKGIHEEPVVKLGDKGQLRDSLHNIEETTDSMTLCDHELNTCSSSDHTSKIAGDLIGSTSIQINSMEVGTSILVWMADVNKYCRGVVGVQRYYKKTRKTKSRIEFEDYTDCHGKNSIWLILSEEKVRLDNENSFQCSDTMTSDTSNCPGRKRKSHRRNLQAETNIEGTSIKQRRMTRLRHPSSQLDVGSRIEVWQSGVDRPSYYPCTITEKKVIDSRIEYFVEYDDEGGKCWLDLKKETFLHLPPRSCVEIRQVVIGSPVEVYWSEDKTYYSGRVIDKNMSSLQVLYDDGEVWKETLHNTRVRLLPECAVIMPNKADKDGRIEREDSITSGRQNKSKPPNTGNSIGEMDHNAVNLTSSSGERLGLVNDDQLASKISSEQERWILKSPMENNKVLYPVQCLEAQGLDNSLISGQENSDFDDKEVSKFTPVGPLTEGSSNSTEKTSPSKQKPMNNIAAGKVHVTRKRLLLPGNGSPDENIVCSFPSIVAAPSVLLGRDDEQWSGSAMTRKRSKVNEKSVGEEVETLHSCNETLHSCNVGSFEADTVETKNITDDIKVALPNTKAIAAEESIPFADAYEVFRGDSSDDNGATSTGTKNACVDGELEIKAAGKPQSNLQDNGSSCEGVCSDRNTCNSESGLCVVDNLNCKSTLATSPSSCDGNSNCKEVDSEFVSRMSGLKAQTSRQGIDSRTSIESPKDFNPDSGDKEVIENAQLDQREKTILSEHANFSKCDNGSEIHDDNSFTTDNVHEINHNTTNQTQHVPCDGRPASVLIASSILDDKLSPSFDAVDVDTPNSAVVIRDDTAVSHEYHEDNCENCHANDNRNEPIVEKGMRGNETEVVTQSGLCDAVEEVHDVSNAAKLNLSEQECNSGSISELPFEKDLQLDSTENRIDSTTVGFTGQEESKCDDNQTLNVSIDDQQAFSTVEDDNRNKRLEPCAICKQMVMERAKATQCSHLFCESCIQLHHTSDKFCPICREFLGDTLVLVTDDSNIDAFAPVEMLDINSWAIISEFPSASSASRTIDGGFLAWKIIKCCRSKKLSNREYGGYYWQFAGSQDLFIRPDFVQQIDLESLLVIGVFPSLHLASQRTGVSQDEIRRVLARKGTANGGRYFWKYVADSHSPWKDPVPRSKPAVEQVCLRTGDIVGTYDSFASAKRAFGCTDNRIREVVIGAREQAFGYFWRMEGSDILPRSLDGMVRHIQIRKFKNGGFLREFTDLQTAASVTGIAADMISELCRSESKAYGYDWSYSQAKAPVVDDIYVGKMLMIEIPYSGEWLGGRITYFDSASEKHCIILEDGEVALVNLTKANYLWKVDQPIKSTKTVRIVEGMIEGDMMSETDQSSVTSTFHHRQDPISRSGFYKQYESTQYFPRKLQGKQLPPKLCQKADEVMKPSSSQSREAIGRAMAYGKEIHGIGLNKRNLGDRNRARESLPPRDEKYDNVYHLQGDPYNTMTRILPFMESCPPDHNNANTRRWEQNHERIYDS